MAVGIEMNPKLIGALLTDQVDNTLRVFCFYTSGRLSQFDVPAAENQDNWHSLFSALNVEPTCSSVIVDEAVQGRICVRLNNKLWLYTVLKSPGSQLPINADIAELPWKIIWRSREMEALQFQPPDGGAPSFALRSPISDEDVTRFLRNSHSFTNAVSPPAPKPFRWSYTLVGLLILLVGAVVAGTAFYTFRSFHAAPAPQAVAVRKPIRSIAPANGGYFLLYHHRISGPYSAQTLAEMNAAGLFSPETLCRPENTTVWSNVLDVFPTPKQTVAP